MDGLIWFDTISMGHEISQLPSDPVRTVIISISNPVATYVYIVIYIYVCVYIYIYVSMCIYI